MDIRDLTYDVQTELKNAEEKLSSILNTIRDGIAPINSDYAGLEKELTHLRSGYDEIRKICAAGNDPDLPVREYLERYERDTLASFERIVRQFLSVTSLSDTYLQALVPYQEKAEQILAQIQAGVNDSALQASITAQELFLQTIIMEEDNEESDETEALYDQLAELYSNKVYRGLLKNSYFIPNGTNSQPEGKSLKQGIQTEEDRIITVESTENVSTTEVDEKTGIIDTNSAEECSDSQPEIDRTELEPEKIEETEESSYIGCPPVSDLSNYGNLVIESTNKGLRGIKAFQKQINQNRTLFMLATRLFNYKGILFSSLLDLLPEITSFSKEEIMIGVDRLYKWGYLAKVYLASDQETVAYKLTPAAETFFHKDSLKAALNNNACRVSGKFISCEINSPLQFLRLADSFKYYSKDNGASEKVRIKLTWSSYSFCTVEYRGLPFVFIITGILSDANEADENLNEMVETLVNESSRARGKTSIFITSASNDDAMAWAQFLKNNNALPKDYEIYYGTVGNDMYMSHEGEQEINLGFLVEALLKYEDPERKSEGHSEECNVVVPDPSFEI